MEMEPVSLLPHLPDSDLFFQKWRENSQWWFKATPQDDAYITETYAHLLNDQAPLHTIANVVVFDQLPCHVFRGHPEAKSIINKYRRFAVDIADSIIDGMHLRGTGGIESLDDIDFVFLLLPYRHTGDLNTCLSIGRLGWDRYETMLKDNVKTEDMRLIKSFIKATYERAPREQEGWVEKVTKPATEPLWKFDVFEDVLEYGPSTLRWKDVSLKEVASIKDALKYHPWPDNIIISLSGGVDSMVIATVLRRMLPNHNIKAVHINYGNRDESKNEEAFVRHWAAILGIPYYVRHITEIQRKQCDGFMRSTYERYTRDVRYSTYSQVTQGSIAHVVLGHHEDDAFENILTNIAHCEKFECLRGMEAITNTQGPCGPLAFHRPLIRVSKKEIYKAACILGIPYLQDSTSQSTQRGTIRDVVRPTLEGWDPCIVRRMLEMADIVSEYASSFEKDVSDAVKQTKLGTDNIMRWSTERNSAAIMSPRFWRRYFQHIIHITPSWRSLDNMRWLVDRMVKKGVNTRLMLVKNVELTMTVDLGGDHVLFGIIRSSLFPASMPVPVPASPAVQTQAQAPAQPPAPPPSPCVLERTAPQAAMGLARGTSGKSLVSMHLVSGC